MNDIKTQQENASGYALVSVIILMAVAAIITIGSLSLSSQHTRTTHATETRTVLYNESEKSIKEVVSWLRDNSQSLVTPFRREEFYTHFDRAEPSEGANEITTFSIPTRLKALGTDDSYFVVNDSSLGTASFPPTKNIVTNAMFDIVGGFESEDLGDSVVRLTLIDAIPDIPSKDYGPPPNPTPETDFFPVYRIDAMTGTDEGSHVYGTLVGDVVHLFDIGIYGQDYLELRQECDSFDSQDGTYSAAIKHANCPAGSNATSQIHKSEAVYGSLRTNGDIVEEAPYGGDVCADFQAGCPNHGEKCTGLQCGVPLLENFDPWNVYCPVEKPAVTYAASGTLSIVDSNSGDPEVIPADKCWDKLTVNNNVTVTLSSTNSPYYIETIDLKNNSNSVLRVDPDPAGGTVELYVNKIVGDKLNGNQSLNVPGRPTQFRLYYLGTDPLTLNGNANMNVALVAPNAQVTVSGSFEYSGALLAKRLVLTGSGGVHYDESLGGTGSLNDVQFRLRDLVQYYR